MALLEQVATDLRYRLSSSHLVGRAATCTLRLTSNRVSSEHAVFHWDGNGWQLKDLGSSNGTFVNGRRLEAGETVAVVAGAVIAFGDSEQFTVIDTERPVAAARGPGDAKIYESDDVLTLPSESEPEWVVFDDGAGKWFAESLVSGECGPIDDRAMLVCNGQPWCVELPVIVAPTDQPEGPTIRLTESTLCFEVSPEAEHVQITIAHRDARVALETRAHSYLLLTLAEIRQSEARPDRSPDEQGWIEREALLDELQQSAGRPVTVEHLNMQIHRARAQLRRANVVDAQRVVERRNLPPRMRLGVGRIDIVHREHDDPH